MSANVYWGVIRKTSSFLMKRNGVTLTKEPNNLKGKNSFRYNGLIHRKVISIEPTKDKKGIEFAIKTERDPQKPAKNMTTVTLKKDGRRTLRSIRNIMKGNHYRHDLRKACYRRASAILRGQKARPVTTRHKKKKE